MVFPVVMYECEMWTIKKAECQRIDVFELWCWRKLLGVPWTARKSNKSILNEINPKYSLEGLVAEAEALKLWPPDVKSQLIGKDPDSGKDWGQKKGTTEDEVVGWHHQLNGHGFGWTPGVGDWREAWCAAVHGVTRSRTWLSDWTELKHWYVWQQKLKQVFFLFEKNFQNTIWSNTVFFYLKFFSKMIL